MSENMTTQTSGFDIQPIINAMIQLQMVNAMMQTMQNAFTGSSGLGGVTKVIEEVLPIIILVKLFDKLGQ